MPTYQYACTDCGERLEAVQKFTDEPLTVCPSCGGKLRKVFSPVGIVFKGSGFYRTDSRSSQKEPAAASANGSDSKKSDSTSSSDSSSGDSSKKSDKKPGEKTGSGTSSSSSSSSSSGSKVA